MRSVVASVAVLAIASISLFACSFNCTTEARNGLIVRVNDAVTGEAVCGANVVVRDGAYTETLMHFGASASDGGLTSCTYAGVTERAGTYDIEVSAPGYAVATMNGVVVSADPCHIRTEMRTVQITPAP